MSESPESIEFVQAAVRDLTAIGFTSSVAVVGDKLRVTLTKSNVSRHLDISAEFLEADSGALTEALEMPMNRERLAIEHELAKAARKRKSAKKAKKRGKRPGLRARSKSARKAKPKKTPVLSASSDSLVAAANAEASAAPAPTDQAAGG